MNYAEREELKDEARQMLETATTAAQKAHAVELAAEAYYHRNTDAPSREVYIAHFLTANASDYPPEAVRLLQQRFPAPGKLRIQPGYSDWNSFGKPGYLA